MVYLWKHDLYIDSRFQAPSIILYRIFGLATDDIFLPRI